MKTNVWLLSILILVSSCSLLSPGGGTVTVLEDWGDTEAQLYKKVGEVSCRSNLFFVTRNVNISRCKDILRNGAYDLKADVLFVDKITPLGSYLNTGYDMKATAYRKK